MTLGAENDTCREQKMRLGAENDTCREQKMTSAEKIWPTAEETREQEMT